eukprot:TRINITY_DN3866_c0_g2_i1.p1 TRINITY_DN3866_c0_g2~~TRINITY_DN3866_c0_g2_i1.p1  ORF type:complete len:735 (+),score=172.80 TRINITY_DN3866_c0_g2_i1:84-2288(+)
MTSPGELEPTAGSESGAGAAAAAATPADSLLPQPTSPRGEGSLCPESALAPSVRAKRPSIGCPTVLHTAAESIISGEAESESDDSDGGQWQGVSLAFLNVNVTRHKKEILQNCSGLIRGGKLTVLLGTEDSGASELMQCLADLYPIKGGSIYANGIPIQASAYRKCVGYVPAVTVDRGGLTVRQALMLTWRMRRKMRSGQEGDDCGWQRAAEVIGLDEYGDCLLSEVTDEVRLRSVIAAELLHCPSVLFVEQATCDDLRSGFRLVQTLKSLARSHNLTVVVTLRFPRKPVFELADDCILLQQGKIAYVGRTKALRSYFSSLRCQIDPHDSPSDFFLDHSVRDVSAPPASPTRMFSAVEQSGSRGAEGVLDFGRHFTNASEGTARAPADVMDFAGEWLRSPQQVDFERRRADYFELAFGVVAPGIPDAISPGTFRRLVEHLRFKVLALRNNWIMMLLVIILVALLGLLAGLVYSRSDENTALGIQNRAGIIFFILSAIMLGHIPTASAVVNDRPAVRYEVKKGYYSCTVYFFSCFLFDIVFVRVTLTVLFGCIAYFLMGFATYAEADSSNPSFGNLVVFMVLTQLCFATISLLVGACATSAIMAQYVMVLIFLFCISQCGFLINVCSFPALVNATQYLSLLRYSYESALISELGGKSFGCNGTTAPPNAVNTYINCWDRVDILAACYNGDEYLNLQGFGDPSKKWYNSKVLGCMICGYFVLAYIAMRWRFRERKV